MRPNRYFADQYEGNADPDLGLYAHHGHVLYAHKASEGVEHVDDRHAERMHRWHEFGGTGLHYHYCRPDQHYARGEAVNFWQAVKPVWQPGDLLALDFEVAYPTIASAPNELYIETLWDLVRDISGRTSRIYGSTSFLKTYTRTSWLRRRGRWQAAYGPKPGRMPWGTGWWAWQYSDGSQGPTPHGLAGIPEGDVSVLNLRTALVLSSKFALRRRRVQHK